jgi:general stress protein YciG
MPQQRSGAALRGFARMDVEQQRKIARKGGANVPHEKRSFARDRALAVDAGRKGGRAVAPEVRSFSTNRDLASEAGRKGGRAAQSERRRCLNEV